MITLKWLDKKSPYVTFGLPHKRGTVSETDSFLLNGEAISTKATAYWHDGSVKWTAHTAVFEGEIPDIFKLEKGSKESESPLSVKEDDGCITVFTGKMTAVVAKNGSNPIKSAVVGEKAVITGSRLVVLNETRSETMGLPQTTTERFESDINEAIIEEVSCDRVVIQLRGDHVSTGSRHRSRGLRHYLPFILRLYFYKNSAEIEIKHTFIFNGAAETDFIRGIGLEFDTPLTGELYNRYARFGGERGMYVDSPKSLLTWRTNGKYRDMYEEQNNAVPVSFDLVEDERFLGLLDESAVWNDFKISQLSSEEYNIKKRVGDGLVYIKGHMGDRAMGVAAVGDTERTLSLHVKDFWQKYPASIEINGMLTETAKMIAWLWSPDAEAMDLRHYDTRTHVYSGYEGFEEMRATPFGIANTSELSLLLSDGIISNTELVAYAERKNSFALLCAEPEYYAGCDVLGEWSVCDRSTPEKARIEDRLDELLELYKREREIRRWYGFWDFGDFMHTYDGVSNCWKYDMGGQAWQNTELVPNLWLWYGFLRTGRVDYFELARAMTRHTSEVDVYHIGEYARLGSRHNVVHWGCGCKESRISMAHLHKIFYYLTADERVGDIMDEVVDSDFAVGELDPMRAYHAPDSKFKTHVRFGPDVMSFCSNWFTYYERHRSKEYLAKLMKTLEFFKNGHRFVVSGVYGYNPQDTEYFDFQVEGGSHFMHCFGSYYVWLEIANEFEDDQIKEYLCDLGQIYGESEADQKFKYDLYKKWGLDTVIGDKRLKHASYNVAISALSAKCRSNDTLAAEIRNMIDNDPWVDNPLRTELIDKDNCHKVFPETKNLSTNAVAQWATNVYVALLHIY